MGQKRSTEDINPQGSLADLLPTGDFVSALLESQIDGLQALRSVIPQIAAAADDAAARLEGNEQGRLVYAGAGTSIRIGVQDGIELTPTFGWPRSRLAFIIAGGQKALKQSVENAEDDAAAARKRISRLKLTFNDVCIATAASGTTPYTLAACQAAKDTGALTIAIASNHDTPLLKVADHAILTQTGAEILSGSTRMSAGTSQKAVMNSFSTALMTRLGHVHDGLMVSMIPTCAKLHKRAAFIVSTIAECETADAERCLRAAETAYGGLTKNNIKLAILIARNIQPDDGIRLLDAHKGHLRPILRSLSPQ